MITHLNTEEEFNNFIKSGNVVIDFFATWCGPCRMLGPVMEELSDENPNVKFAKVDVDEVSQVASRYGISAIPAVFFFKDGTLVADQVGFLPKDAMLDKMNKAFADTTYSF